VLLDAAVLADRSLRADLAEARQIVAEQLHGERMKDPWAYCDLGTISLLLGEDDAGSTVNQLARLRPPLFVYESWLTTLDPLADVAAGHRPGLRQATGLIRWAVR
jgi:hypothetical protein